MSPFKALKYLGVYLALLVVVWVVDLYVIRISIQNGFWGGAFLSFWHMPATLGFLVGGYAAYKNIDKHRFVLAVIVGIISFVVIESVVRTVLDNVISDYEIPVTSPYGS